MSNDIKSGLTIGLSKILGSDAASLDGATYDKLLGAAGLESITNKTDAADLDLEEMAELLFAAHEAWWQEDDGDSSTPQTEKQKELGRIKSSLLEALGLTNQDFEKLYNKNKDKPLDEKVDAVAVKSGEKLGIIDPDTSSTADIDDVKEKIEDKIDTYESEVFSEMDYSSISKGNLVAVAGDPDADTLFQIRALNALAADSEKSEGIAESFSKLYEKSPDTYQEDTILLLTSIAEYFANDALDINEEQFNNIFKEAIDALPEEEREDFLQGIIDITGESENSEYFIDREASNFLLDAASDYADDNDSLSKTIKDSLSTSKKNVSDRDNVFQDDTDLSTMSENDLVAVIAGDGSTDGAAAASGTPATTGADTTTGTPVTTATGTPATTATGTPATTGADTTTGTPATTGADTTTGTPATTGADTTTGTPATTGADAASGTSAASNSGTANYTEKDKVRALNALAADPEKRGGLGKAFGSLYQQDPAGYKEEVISLLVAMSKYNADGDISISKDHFQDIFKEAINALPAADRGGFLQGILDATEEREGSHRIVDEKASAFLIDIAFSYADDNFDSENGITSTLMRDLSKANEELSDISDSEDASESDSDLSNDSTSDVDTFLMTHFKEWDEDKLFRNGILKSSHRSDVNGIVDAMISDGMTDAGSIIELMDRFPVRSFFM